MSHTFVSNLYHIIWHTKNREKFIANEFQDNLYSYIGGTVKGLKGIPITIRGTNNHIHLLCAISIDLSTSEFIRDIKAQY